MISDKEAVNTLQHRVAIQKHLIKLENWAERKFRKLSQGKFKVLPLKWKQTKKPTQKPKWNKTPIHWDWPRAAWLERNSAEKDMGVLAQQQTKTNQQCVLAAKKAKHILGYISRNVASR